MVLLIFLTATGFMELLVFRNLNETEINRSLDELAGFIRESQVLALCGGFSAGDEPDGKSA